MIKARFLARNDTYTTWFSEQGKKVILLPGEFGVCTISIEESEIAFLSPGTYLKIGDGKTTFENLPWLNSLSQADWDEINESMPTYIKNKPEIITSLQYLDDGEGNVVHVLGSSEPDKILLSYEGKLYSVYPSVFAPKQTWYKGATDKATITKINIVDTYEPTGNEIERWNADYYDLGYIKCYIEGTILTIVGNGYGKISTHMNSQPMFQNFNSIIEISGLDMLDTSATVRMAGMFNKCYKLTSLDVSTFDMSNVVDARQMFGYCNALADLNVGHWDTSSLTDVSAMFGNCSSLITIDLNGWNTSKVTNMRQLFANCQSLTTLDLSSWDTSKVTNMSGMFQLSGKLETINVTGWNTSAVTDMSAMFAVGASLSDAPTAKLREIIGIENFDVSNVKTMESMFYGATMEELPISGWDMRILENASHIFCRCYNLSNESIQSIVNNWQLDSCISYNAMFHSCWGLINVDVSQLLKPVCRITSQMFENCQNLVTITGLNVWDTSNIDIMQEMFYNCRSLKELNLDNWNTINLNGGINERDEEVSGMNDFFLHMKSLERVILGKDFVFKDNAILPTPSNEYILGVTGNWVDEATGVVYIPADIPAAPGVVRTYVAENEFVEAPELVGVWKIIGDPASLDLGTYYLDFISDNESFSTIRSEDVYGNGMYRELHYDNKTAYTSEIGSWIYNMNIDGEQRYATITITEIPAVSAYFKTWLLANAIKQS